MIFAAIGSINGDDRALNAVLDAIADQGMHVIVHTGNAVAGNGDVNRVMALLGDHGVICVQGNTDRLVVRFSRKRDTMEKIADGNTRRVLQRAHEELASENLERLRDWRKSRRLALEEYAGFVCHGSPGNPREVLTPATPIARLQRQREVARADVIVCGGATAPFSRIVDGALFVAPGDISAGGNTFSYTLINTETTPFTVTVESIAC